MEKEYPKVLIISSSFLDDNTNQTSITMNSYFGKWPKDKIAQIVAGQFNLPEHGISNNHFNTYILDNSDIYFLRNVLKVNREPQLKGSERLPAIPQNSSLQLRLKLSLRTIVTTPLDFLKYNISDDLLSFIENFSPEIIYLIPGGYRILKLADKISVKYDLNIVPHFMDDWPTTIYTYPFTKLQRKLVLSYLKSFLLKVPACLCISEYMCREFEKRYQLESCYSLMNCIDEYHGTPKIHTNAGVVKIGYFGGLHLQRNDIIKNLYKQIEKYSFFPFELIIHTSESSLDDDIFRFSEFPNIKYGGYVNHDNIFKVIENYDILLHVESFDESLINYTRYSISTKIPEYLSTGIPILAVGPSGIASIRYLNDNKAAFVISDLEDDLLIKSILNDLSDESQWKVIVENAKNLFYRNHLKANQVILPILKEYTKVKNDS